MCVHSHGSNTISIERFSPSFIFLIYITQKAICFTHRVFWTLLSRKGNLKKNPAGTYVLSLLRFRDHLNKRFLSDFMFHYDLFFQMWTWICMAI